MMHLIKTLILISIAASLLGCNQSSGTVVNGELDLKNWSGKPIDLEGEWQFNWDEYAHHLSNRNSSSLVKVPEQWNSLADSLQWKAFGKGVYRIKLKNVPDRQLALKISSRVFCSYRLIVDDVEISRAGQTGFDGAYDPEMKSQLIPLPTGKKDIVLAIEVANFTQRRGGILHPPRLGKLTDVIAESRLNVLPELIAITIILVISFIGFNLYSINRNNKLHLYLGILAVASILRQITIGEVLYKMIWPDGPYIVFEILRHCGLLVSLAVSARFIRTLFRKNINQNILKGMEAFFYILILFIIITPIWLNSYISSIAQPMALWMMLNAIYVGIRYRKDYYRVEWFMAGAIAVILVFTHDIFVANLWITGDYLQSYGMSVFIICYAIYVNKTSQNIQRRHSALSRQLTELSVISNKKKELDEEVTDTLKQIRPSLDTSVQKRTNELIQEINQYQNVSDRQNILQQTLLESNEQFLDNLRQRFPKLTRNEEEICLLFRAKLSTKEIAQVRKITVESAKVARKRLRKKLNLEPDQDIHQFINSI